MISFICPVCKNELTEYEKLYKCENGHSFDKSKFGYVNLLQSQQSSAKRHGDDRLMVRSRRDFLNKGYYAFLLKAVYGVCDKYLPDNADILDAGCGECYYSSGIKQLLSEKGRNADFSGVDISKDALEFASKRKSGIKTAVASLFDLPFADESFDGVLNIFSPEADSEFLRVLKKGGIMIRVIPLEEHLFDLKAVIYDNPYKNDVPDSDVTGFRHLESIRISDALLLDSNEDVQNLFKMTPYYYKTGKEDQKKINCLEKMSVKAEFEMRIYEKE